MTTLGRAASLRIAYQTALHDLAAMTAERDALKRQVGDKYEIAGRSLLGVMHVDSRIEELENRAFGQLERAVAASEALVRQRDTALARAETAEAEVKRLRAIFDSQVTTFPSSFIDEGMLVLCRVCGSLGEKGDTIETLQHKPGCIVAEALTAQKEASR